MQQRSCVQSREGEVKQEKIGTPPSVLRSKPIKKVPRALGTLQHLQNVWHPLRMEHLRDAIHLRRMLVHHGNGKREAGVCRRLPQPEEDQREQPAGHIEHTVSYCTSAILRERLMILIEACIDRHKHKGAERPAPVPRCRRMRPPRPPQEARQDGIFGEMRPFAYQEMEQGIVLRGYLRHQPMQHLPEDPSRVLGGKCIR